MCAASPLSGTGRLLLAAALLACSATAQCSFASGPGDPVSTPRGKVSCSVLWDPDGAGPAPVALVVGGSFTVGSGDTQVAMWDGSAWTSLGQIVPSTNGVGALAVWNGDLVAAVGATVYRRSGGTWLTLGSGGSGPTIAAMTVFNGDLVVAGDFLAMNGTAANCVARWNGTTWAALGAGVSGGSVRALAVYTFLNQSALYVGGSFTHAAGLASNCLAVWTGSSWFATPGCDAPVNALATRLTAAVTTSYLILGGEFATAGGVAADKVARFSVATNTWTGLGTTPSTLLPVRTLLVRSFVSSYEVAAGQGDRVLLWAGSGWGTLGPALTTQFDVSSPGAVVRTVSYFGGSYVAGLTDAFFSGGVRAFDGTAWQTLDGAGIPRPVRCVLPTDGDVVIGGAFATISGATRNGIARGNANAWQPLGGGVTGGNGSVDALVRLPDGDIVAGGTFSIANGGVADRIARWNGTSWQPLGLGTNGPVRALAVMPNGDLIAGGSFSSAGGVLVANIARWNGSAWSDCNAGCNGPVNALCVTGGGDLIVGGEFYEVGPLAYPAAHIAVWNNGWGALGAGLAGTVNALAATPGGSFVAGGAFQQSGSSQVHFVARWNGFGFTPLPYSGQQLDAQVFAVAVLPDASIVVGGATDNFSTTGGAVSANVARIVSDYSTWEPLPVGGSIAPAFVRAMATTATGEIVVGGYFHGAGGAVAGNVARIASTCPAAAVPYGSGCVGAGGANLLVATTLPWDGAVLHTRATGMPPLGVALVLFGFTQVSAPLAALLPEGAPGCDLLTTPDIVLAALPVAGVLDTAIFLAPSPSLVGVTFFHQVVPFQNFGSGPLVITATNGLALTGGSY